MKRFAKSLALALACTLGATALAHAGRIEGVITGYSSGNKGSDLIIRTRDGAVHDFWFDNMRKPLFEGHELPYCPDWPCNGWPKQLVLNKTRVRVYLAPVQMPSDGNRVRQSPTEIVIVH